MTNISWTNETWNPVVGCSVVSEGCTNCYAMKMAGTRLAHTEAYEGLTRESGGRPKWTGEVRFNEKALLKPLKWKKPRKIFVCSMSDLFHENVKDEWIDQVFAVMALCPQHTFQVLTKRPERMQQYLCSQKVTEDGRSVSKASWCVEKGANWIAVMSERNVSWRTQTQSSDLNRYEGKMTWPLSNVWLGTSVENQDTVEARIPILLDTPAAVRFISAEPLLGPIDLTRLEIGRSISGQTVDLIDALQSYRCELSGTHESNWHDPSLAALDWVIGGGESGQAARPTHPDWVRFLRDQCVAADVAFHFKQWGEWAPKGGTTWSEWIMADGRRHSGSFDTRSHLESVLPPDSCGIQRVGKHAAGRELDGQTWNQYPGEAA